MSGREYEYYAFISYRRTDEKWARWIQRRLETYRFPVALKKEYTSLPKKIFPIFRDKTDLTSGELWEQLKKQLEDSEYLIVICSPNSANAEWVNNEVAYFQELGRNENIIPLIVDGQPHSEDSETECFCPALRDNADKELLGVSVAELGKKKAVLRVIASIMHLKYDQLVMRDKKRTVKRRITAAAAGTALAAAAFGVFWYNIPHSSYYWSFVYKNEIPEGRTEISKRERQKTQGCYKIVTQRNRVVRLEYVNSADTPISPPLSLSDSLYSVIEFSYNDNGSLSSAVFENAAGEPQIIKRYDGIDAVNFINPNNPSLLGNFSQGVDETGIISAAFEVSEDRFEITRMLLEHDENGFLIKERYMWDNRNTPACDSNGVFEVRYTYDESGNVICMENLGRSGELLYENAASVFRFAYNERGQVTETACFDSQNTPVLDDNNAASSSLLYDENGACIRQMYYDTEGAPCCDAAGVSDYEFVYDDNGFMTETSFFDENGSAAYIKNMGVHKIVYHNDGKGAVIGQTFYDENGEKMYDITGVASYAYTFDRRNRLTSVRFYDIDGELTYYRMGSEYGNANQSIRQGGAIGIDTYGMGGNAAGVDVEYPDEYTMRNTYIDKSGKPAKCFNGYAVLENKYNKDGMKERMNFYDENGAPVRAAYNAASIVYQYNDSSKVSTISYLDENGALCLNMLGFAEARPLYDYSGRPAGIEYFDTQGEPCWVHHTEGGSDNFSKVEMEFNSLGKLAAVRYRNPAGDIVQVEGKDERRIEYDERGNCTSIKNYSVMGNLMNDSSGAAVVNAAYDEQGREISRYYLDSKGEYMRFGDHMTETAYDSRGNIACETSYSYDDAGNIVCTRIAYEYDSRNRKTKEYYVDENGRLLEEDGIAGAEYTYDARDHCTSVRFFDRNGDTAQNISAMIEYEFDEYGDCILDIQYAYYENELFPVRFYEYSYDEYGNQVSSFAYNSEGEPVADENDIAGVVAVYDAMENIIRSTYYNSKGEIAFNPESGYAIAVFAYDSLGNAVKTEYYDEHEQPLTRKSGWPACMTTEYNEFGYLAGFSYYDENGALFRGSDYDYAGIKIFYDAGGVRLYEELYDEDSKLVKTMICLLEVGDVKAGSTAEKAGVQAGDLLIGFNAWNYFDAESYREARLSEFHHTIAEATDQEKHIVAFRLYEENGESFCDILNFDIPAGQAGIHFVNSLYAYEDVEYIESVYREYLKRKGAQ